jgi:hypothetical protein
MRVHPSARQASREFQPDCACRNSVQSKKVLECEEGREVKNFLSIARGERIQGFNTAMSGNGEMRGNAVRVSFADNRDNILQMISPVGTAPFR